MAQDGCWGPKCEFTGSRDSSDATPGRCTRTPGYVAYAEITELITNPGEKSSRTFFDKQSRTDVMVYNGELYF